MAKLAILLIVALAASVAAEEADRELQGAPWFCHGKHLPNGLAALLLKGAMHSRVKHCAALVLAECLVTRVSLCAGLDCPPYKVQKLCRRAES